MSIVAENKVVIFHYTLTNEQGNVIDSSEGQKPMPYLHGAGNIIPGLEREMAGKKVGDEFTIIELGEKIKDSYTNEYIGREQKEVGKLEITQVNSKTSSGKILEQNYVLEENFEPKKYILRKIITNVSDIDIAKDKINAKKKEGDTDDDW